MTLLSRHSSAWLRIFFLALALSPYSVARAEDHPTDDPLQRLVKAVESFCQRPPLEYKKNTFSASAEAEAKASVLTRILSDAGIKLDSKFEHEASSGVTAEKLGDAIESGNDCAKKLVPVLMPLVLGLVQPEPSFAVTFKQNDDIWLVNSGAPEENLAIRYVALAWVWILGPPETNGCNLHDGTTLAEAVAVAAGNSSNGLVAAWPVADVRKTAAVLPKILAKSGQHSCSHKLVYSISLSYDDRGGRPQQRYYSVTWTAVRGTPEARSCRKISKEDFGKATANYEIAVRAGSRWNFHDDPEGIASFVALLTRPRGTVSESDQTAANDEEIRKIFDEPPPRPCHD